MSVEVKSEGALMPEIVNEVSITAVEEPIKEKGEAALKAVEEPTKEREAEAKPATTMVEASEKKAEDEKSEEASPDLEEKRPQEEPKSERPSDPANVIEKIPSFKEEKQPLEPKSEGPSDPANVIDKIPSFKEEEQPQEDPKPEGPSDPANVIERSPSFKEEKRPQEEPKPEGPSDPANVIERSRSFKEEEQPQEEPKSEGPSDPANVIEKSPSFKEEGSTLSDLSDAERKALIELRAKVEEAIVENKLFKTQDENDDGDKKSVEIDRDVSLWGVPLSPSKNSDATDVVLVKFLRAREFKPKESFEMLRSCLQWRRDENIDSVAGEAELGADFAAACYMDGYDRDGHPVCYNVPAVFRDEEASKKAFGSEEGRRRFLRWRVQVMEKGIERLDLRPGGVSDLLQVTDLKNSVGPSRKDVRETMKQAVHILQDNYPEFVARNIFINVPFWYYAFYALLAPFFTQRTKSKFEFARPSQATETLLKYIPAEALPAGFGGFKRENDDEFSVEDAVSELMVKSSSTETIEIPVPGVGTTLAWDLLVVGWDVNYKEEFVPDDQGSYTVVIVKGKKMAPQDETTRNSYTNSNDPGKIVLTIENKTSKKKKVLYRYKAKSQ